MPNHLLALFGTTAHCARSPAKASVAQHALFRLFVRSQDTRQTQEELSVLLACVLDDLYLDKKVTYMDFPAVMKKVETVFNDELAREPTQIAAMCCRTVVCAIAETHLSADYVAHSHMLLCTTLLYVDLSCPRMESGGSRDDEFLGEPHRRSSSVCRADSKSGKQRTIYIIEAINGLTFLGAV